MHVNCNLTDGRGAQPRDVTSSYFLQDLQQPHSAVKNYRQQTTHLQPEFVIKSKKENVV